jgi:hypothetical protein
MTQKIGPRELALREKRERDAAALPKPLREDIAATLPKTSGKKPVKRKAKR